MKKQTQHTFTMRCTDELAAKLKAEADRLGMSVAAFLRMRAVEYFNKKEE